MKTLKGKKQLADRSVKKGKKTKVVSLPTEIIEDILSRLPVKSILRSRSVSKPWLSLISDPSFNKLQFSRATTTHIRTGLFFSAYDHSTKKRYYLTAANDGGPLTLLVKINEDVGFIHMIGPSLPNGLMCFTSRTWIHTSKSMNSHAFVVNPATRKVFKLPDMNSPSEYTISGYLYGYDESRKEHKILLFKKVYETKTFEFMIYSMLSFSWRKIDAEPPFVGFNWDLFDDDFDGGVCVNSVVHLLLDDLSCRILAFDFVTEKFSIIRLPQCFFPDDDEEDDEEGFEKFDSHTITKIDGCLGVVLHDWGRSEVCIWLLQDYHKCLWVKETINLPESWNDIAANSPPSIDVNMEGEIVFSMSKVTKNAMIIPVYNRKSKCFKTVQFTFDNQFASPKAVKFRHIRCYVETIMPLNDNWTITSHGQRD